MRPRVESQTLISVMQLDTANTESQDFEKFPAIIRTWGLCMDYGLWRHFTRDNMKRMGNVRTMDRVMTFVAYLSQGGKHVV